MYRVIIPGVIQRSISRIKGRLAERIGLAIDKLAADPRPHGCLKMKITKEWRIRVGNYRIRYTIDDTQRVVRITGVSPRDDAYMK